MSETKNPREPIIIELKQPTRIRVEGFIRVEGVECRYRLAALASGEWEDDLDCLVIGAHEDLHRNNCTVIVRSGFREMLLVLRRGRRCVLRYWIPGREGGGRMVFEELPEEALELPMLQLLEREWPSPVDEEVAGDEA